MTNYRDKFYSQYVSTHTSHLYGEVSLGDIKRQFPIWQDYFGSFLPKDKNAKIIDLGCGSGSLVYWLQSIGYQNAQGVDISIEQVELAHKLGIKNIKRDDVRQYIKHCKEEFDLIFMRDLLEHFNKEEILNTLENIFSSLRKNGKVIIQVPNAENILSGRIRYGDFTHELAFTENSMRQILLVSGFKHTEIFPQRPVIHGLKSFIRYFLWKLIELGLRFYLLIETGSSKGIFTQNLIAVAEK